MSSKMKMIKTPLKAAISALLKTHKAFTRKSLVAMYFRTYPRNLSWVLSINLWIHMQGQRVLPKFTRWLLCLWPCLCPYWWGVRKSMQGKLYSSHKDFVGINFLPGDAPEAKCWGRPICNCMKDLYGDGKITGANGCCGGVCWSSMRYGIHESVLERRFMF